ncbi:MAG: hypothetical protein PHQ36_03650 [Anaerolineales bacterium]|nr:hypothetical protein [Anaerolineales bacterium]
MNTEQKPTLFIVIAILTLVSGIVNLFWGFVASATALGTIVGVICLPITVLPTILGVFEIIYAAKLFSAQPQPVQPSQPLAIFQISTFIYGNIFSAVVGVLNLIFFNDLSVKEYFAKINGAQIMTPAPVPTPEPEPAPIIEPVLPEEPADDAAKPKRVRKIAGR